jgi:pseudouridine synthase
MIRQGRVTVNGEIVTAMGVTVDPRTDSITVDGSPLGRADRKKTYLFYKPPGFICTRDDPHGRSTIFDILPDEVGTGLHTAGRLDMDAEGALILTNDGELTRTLTHPSSHLPKTYLVKVKGEVLLRALKKLRRGVELEDGLTLPASVSVIKGKGTERNTWLRIVLREGRKNQIKRMCDAVGHRVLSIKRISIGGMVLPDKMKPGSFKKLSRKEIETLIGGREKTVQSPKPKGQREEAGPISKGARGEGKPKGKGWAIKSTKPERPRSKPGEKGRRGGQPTPRGGLSPSGTRTPVRTKRSPGS